MGTDAHTSVCFLDNLHHGPKVQIGGSSVKTNRIVSDLRYFRGESAVLTLISRYTERDPLTPIDEFVSCPLAICPIY